MVVDDWRDKPPVWGFIQLAGRRGRKIEVSKDGMDGDNDHNNQGAEMRARHIRHNAVRDQL